MTYIIIRLINMLFNILEIAIVIECIFSWIPSQGQRNKFIDLVQSFTYPILEPFRKLQDRFITGLPIDLSPIFAFFAIDIIRRVLIGIII